MKITPLILFLSLLLFANFFQVSDSTTRILVHKSNKSLYFIFNHKKLDSFSALWIEMPKTVLDNDVNVYFDDDITFSDFNDLKGFFGAYGIKNVNFYCINWKTKKMSNIAEKWVLSNVPSDLDAD
jgi:hypothetical protein